MDRKQKYVRLKGYNQIIIFHPVIQHGIFKRLEPVSAGFCYVNSDHVTCFGQSDSLELDSDPKEDSELATIQLFGPAAVDNVVFQCGCAPFVRNPDTIGVDGRGNCEVCGGKF